MITVDLSITGDEIEFEAIGEFCEPSWSALKLAEVFVDILMVYHLDGIGVYPITEEYAAKCGYTIRVLPLQRLAELRASYLSCHTDNQVQFSKLL